MGAGNFLFLFWWCVCFVLFWGDFLMLVVMFLCMILGGFSLTLGRAESLAVAVL